MALWCHCRTSALSQWFLKMPSADDLLAAIETLERWPDRVRLMQHNWIDDQKVRVSNSD